MTNEKTMTEITWERISSASKIAEENAEVLPKSGGKKYVKAQDRVIGFRTKFPDGFIRTDIQILDKQTVLAKAEIYINGEVVATGSKLRSGNDLNKESLVEKAETGAVSRALGMLGVGTKYGIADYDDMKEFYDKQTGEVFDNPQPKPWMSNRNQVMQNNVPQRNDSYNAVPQSNAAYGNTNYQQMQNYSGNVPQEPVRTEQRYATGANQVVRNPEPQRHEMTLDEAMNHVSMNANVNGNRPFSCLVLGEDGYGVQDAKQAYYILAQLQNERGADGDAARVIMNAINSGQIQIIQRA